MKPEYYGMCTKELVLARIDLIAGARPNFMKIAPIIRAMGAYPWLKYRLVHTGQHYDASMSADFFSQLEIPNPDVNLEVGSGTQAAQAAAIMTRYEELLMSDHSDLCLVVGDVTSTMACALAAKKLSVMVAHVEGGLRSGDWSMPEEINRIVTDSITDHFFTTSEYANQNLQEEGVDDNVIHFVGNTMVDTLLHNIDRLRFPSFWNQVGLKPGGYLVLTLHRPSNVDDIGYFSRLLQIIAEGAQGYPLIFPVHPRTAKAIKRVAMPPANMIFVEPQPYLEFNYLVRNSMGVITDSGGVTEETTVMGIPCMTLRNTTERPETVYMGTNVLLGSDQAALVQSLAKLIAGNWKSGTIPALWDGAAAPRIVSHLESILATGRVL
jgi:UDP-N-acetylglucosamine 2-epimerase (non-hydrolysing)